jgi:uncharacterized membrane protein HdeD (DUF308 family)
VVCREARLWVGVVWCCIGLAWPLFAAFEGPTLTRILLGAFWLALGIFHGTIALRQRRAWRRFQQTSTSALVSDEVRLTTAYALVRASDDR